MRDDSEPGLLSVPCLGWSLLFFLSITTFSCFVASVPFIQVEWSLTNTEASIVFSSYLIGYAISALVYVPLSDRFRPGFMFLAGVAGICIPNLLFPIVAEDAWTGSGLRALAGAGQALAYTTGMRLVASRFTARQCIYRPRLPGEHALICTDGSTSRYVARLAIGLFCLSGIFIA